MKIKNILFIALASFVACKDDGKEKKFSEKTYEAKKESVEEVEKKNAPRFLSIESKDRKNLIGQTVVKGSIYNSATIAVYKDIELRLSFYSKTKTKLDEGIETIYETVSPGQTVKFKTKYFAPKGTDSVAIKVMKAAVQ